MDKKQKKHIENQKYYKKHREQIIEKQLEYYRKKNNINTLSNNDIIKNLLLKIEFYENKNL